MGDFIFGDLRTLSAAIAIGLGGFAPASNWYVGWKGNGSNWSKS